MRQSSPSRAVLRAFWRHAEGTTAAEFALVLPIFLLTVFGTMNMAFALSALIQLHYVTEKVARCISVDPTGTTCTTANIDTYAKGLYQGSGISGLTFTASAPACGNKVDASGNYQLFTGVGSLTIGMSASSCYPKI
ncbi:TadE/TadG family type IV pilus assembly protein [Sphingobium estronivorans]|uniref:TadE/TadG family type IV pilus assembly protein n=1 Tax=Sphingobium estronivorans TaxID=1577690 RepID=UPI0013C36FA8|nr:TadE/TadG family type IV pilus assembly protein [Sphingobium estronivorans]